MARLLRGAAVLQNPGHSGPVHREETNLSEQTEIGQVFPSFPRGPAPAGLLRGSRQPSEGVKGRPALCRGAGSRRSPSFLQAGR
ncbi:hypothetical protein FQA47_020305 [Oryzias melastigma]|uniref:Uncharacterized protein n=1 Tax=Oryzias melastigma TaxID=30732 RepID=A0A834FKP9_ORYME|nr:hypothetical protein FQA47_020305 [Oryzias melastigma]